MSLTVVGSVALDTVETPSGKNEDGLGVFDEWTLCEGHPARNQLLVGLARWATDTRRRIGTQSASQTALRFARGETAVELYEAGA